MEYTEGLLVGYKWYEAKGKPVLFPFGYGLSYTTFAYSGLQVAPDGRSARVTVSNTGTRTGRAVAELYVSLPPAAGEPERLAGWGAVTLKPKESREVILTVEPLAMAVYDVRGKRSVIPQGPYTFRAGGSSVDLPAVAEITLAGQQVAP